MTIDADQPVPGAATVWAAGILNESKIELETPQFWHVAALLVGARKYGFVEGVNEAIETAGQIAKDRIGEMPTGIAPIFDNMVKGGQVVGEVIVDNLKKIKPGFVIGEKE